MNRKLLSITVLTFALFLSSHAVFANSSVGATEPNNTIAEATQIQRNNADHPDKQAETYYGEIGTLDDVDIFKVNLPAGDNTLIVQAYYADFNVTVYNQFEGRYHEEAFNGRNQQYNFRLNPNEAGTYYIRIATQPGTQPDLSKKPAYKLIVGNPYYSWGNYTQKNLGSLSITPRSKTSNIPEFSLITENSIPNGAIVDSIRFGGRESGSVSGRVRSVKAVDGWRWLDGKEFLFETANVSTSYSPVYLKQKWQYKHSASSFGYTQSYTLTPEVYFKYYYAQDLDNYIVKF